jgi:hypothetical protein
MENEQARELNLADLGALKISSAVSVILTKSRSPFSVVLSISR